MSRTSKTTIGTINITTLRDGERTLPLEALKNLSNEDTDEINSNEKQLLTFTNFNACVIQNGKQNLLVDTGCGNLFGPTCGFLLDALNEMGLEPEDISDIFMTHLHPDHMGGAINENGSAIFRQCKLQTIARRARLLDHKNF